MRYKTKCPVCWSDTERFQCMVSTLVICTHPACPWCEEVFNRGRARRAFTMKVIDECFEKCNAIINADEISGDLVGIGSELCGLHSDIEDVGVNIGIHNMPNSPRLADLYEEVSVARDRYVEWCDARMKETTDEDTA